jgi:glycosyltransferase involved in cell wall biosynthesis
MQVGAPPDGPLAVMLANLSPHKGQETAIRTAALLKARGIDVRFWLAGSERGGSTTYSTHLESLIRELGVADRVTLLGQRTDSPDLLRAADFFLLPSTCEGLPISLLEAQASGVPVLAAPTAGVPEAVEHGATGLLIPADDPAGYADHIARLLADRERSQRMTDAALRKVRTEYNWTTFCRRILALYQDVSGPGGSGPDGRSRPTAEFPRKGAGSSPTPASAGASWHDGTAP